MKIESRCGLERSERGGTQQLEGFTVRNNEGAHVFDEEANRKNVVYDNQSPCLEANGNNRLRYYARVVPA